MSVAIFGLLGITILRFNHTFPCRDDKSMENFTVFIMQGIGVLLSVLNFALAIVINKQLKALDYDDDITDEVDILNKILNQKQDSKMKRHQIRILA